MLLLLLLLQVTLSIVWSLVLIAIAYFISAVVFVNAPFGFAFVIVCLFVGCFLGQPYFRLQRLFLAVSDLEPLSILHGGVHLFTVQSVSALACVMFVPRV